MQNQIKELRVKIDGLSQLTKELKQLHIGDKFIAGADNIVYRHKDIGEYWQPKEIEKAYDSLILAKAWLGKVLGELGENTPYTNDGKRKTVEDIEPASDVNKEVEIGNAYWETLTGWGDKNHIEKVDWLRQAISNLLKAPLLPFNRSTTFEVKHIYIEYAWKELQLARFWLGFELQRIKENESINKSSTIM